MAKYIFLLLAAGVLAQPLPWKHYVTLHPDEGTAFRLDSAAVVRAAGVPGFNAAASGLLVFGWAANGRSAGTTTDSGRTWTRLNGITQPLHPDGGFIYLPTGALRYITEEPAPGSTPTRHKSRLISYYSTDGLNFSREPGIRYQPGTDDDSISSVCEVIQVQDSIWRMYFVGDWYRSNGIRTALSTDWGVTWLRESFTNILRKGDVDPHPVYLTNGRIRLYFRGGMNRPFSQSGIFYCESNDGRFFDTLTVKMLFSDSMQPAMLKLDPLVVKLPGGNIVCYVGAAPIPGIPAQEKIIAAWGLPSTSVQDKDTGELPELAVYPNPAAKEITLWVLPAYSGGGYRFGVFSLLGERLFSEQVTAPLRMHWAPPAPGVYIAVLTGGGKTTAIKFVIR